MILQISLVLNFILLSRCSACFLFYNNCLHPGIFSSGGERSPIRPLLHGLAISKPTRRKTPTAHPNLSPQRSCRAERRSPPKRIRERGRSLILHHSFVHAAVVGRLPLYFCCGPSAFISLIYLHGLGHRMRAGSMTASRPGWPTGAHQGEVASFVSVLLPTTVRELRPQLTGWGM